MAIEIRRMGADDADLLTRVEDDVFDGPIDRARLEAYLVNRDHMMVLALEDGVVVGQGRGIVHLQPDEPPGLYVDNLGVAERLQRRGIARRIMQELFAWGRELGCTTAWVATESDNLPAVGLYRALGAEPQTMAYFEYADLD